MPADGSENHSLPEPKYPHLQPPMNAFLRLRFLLLFVCVLGVGNQASAQFQPTDVGGLLIWFAADSNVTKSVSNDVSQWDDLSGNGNHATQGVGSSQPLWVDSVPELNYKPVVRFDQDYMNFPELTSIRTVFILVNHESGGPVSGTSPLLGHSSAIDFYSDGTNVIGSFASATVKNGAGAVNGVATSPTAMAKSTQYSVITLVPTANATAERITKDRGFNFYWDGDFVEIIIYDNALSAADQDSVETYLFNKYAPPVDLGADINKTYGFCDVELNAGAHFTSYAWSTGDSTSTVVATQPGTYWVDVVDIFGRTSTDTVVVNISGQPNSFADSVVCLGDTIFWNTGLNSGTHSFLWSDASTDSLLPIAAGGNVFVAVTDTSGCTFESDTFSIALDTFPQLLTLGPDTNLCSGNNIGLKAGAGQAVAYLWNNGAATPLLPITTTGTYHVTATDANGCTGRDTISVTIVGAAPLIGFANTTPCDGDTTHFTDQTVPVGNGIATWHWNFGDGNTDTVPSPSHLYVGADTAYNVTLTVLDSAGCGGVLTQTAHVIQPPTLAISFNTPSVGSPVTFTPSMSFTVGDALDSIQWSFGNGDSSVLLIPTETYTASGFLPVDYQVFTDSGCSYLFDTLITVFDSAAAFPPVTLVSPANQLIVSGNSIDFVWDAVNLPGATYDFELATDSAFSNVLASAQAYDTNAFSVSGLPTDTVLYWRVRAFSGTSFSAFSATWSVELFSPDVLAGMLLWYKGDAGTIVSGDTLVTWQDQSGNGNHATQVDAAERPLLADSANLLNYQPVAHFDGVNDFMEFTNVNTIRSVFFVMNWTGTVPGSGTFPTLGHGTSFDFFAEQNSVVGTFADNNLKNGEAWVNTLSAAPTSIGLPVDYSIISFATLGDLEAERITYDRNISGSVWEGDYAEIMLFDNVLDSADRVQVETYLRNKYAPPVNLGPDRIVAYGFCPETLDAQDRFVSYAWSTGDTAATIDVTESGTYTVTATDVFGFVSSDSIRVIYPFLPQADTLICFGDTAFWDPGVDTASYTLTWSNGFAGSVLPMSTAAPYWLVIDDTTMCSYSSDTITLSVDSFPAVVDLGADTAVCRFNAVALIAGAAQAQSYVWSNGETTPQLVIDSAATYTLIAQDSVGCQGFDTLTVSLTGEAPAVNFTVPSTCYGETTQFTNLSTAPNGLQVEWIWGFGDGDSSMVENPQHTYPDSLNQYNVSLTVVDSSGCENTVSKSIAVILTPSLTVHYPFPVFVDSLVAYNYSGSFDSGDGAAAVFWDFGNGDSLYTDTSATIYTSPGPATIALEITSDSGCVTTIDSTITVMDPTPVMDAVTLVAPLSAAITTATATTFEWNAAEQQGVEYHLQLSTTAGFSAGVTDFYMIDTTAFAVSGLVAGQQYFWRVRYYMNGQFSAYSNAWTFTVFDPAALQGMLLWYAADAGIVANAGDSISQWSDQSGNANHATQAAITSQPMLVGDVPLLNHLPAVRFDGLNDYMEFAEEDSIRTVFFVYKHADGQPSAGTFPTLGHSVTFDFFASGNSVFANSASANVLTGQAYENKAQLAPSLVELPLDYTILALETTGPAEAERITRDRGFAANVWEGDFAEIILLDQVLPSGNREQVEDYLRWKYAPPVNLGPDIRIDYGFCPVTLSAGDRFASYAWNTGATTESIQVTRSGIYTVTTTDVFGFVSMDSVAVRFPVMEGSDTLICIGESVVWNSGLTTANYTINWSNGSTDTAVVMSTESSYWFTATDTNLCNYASDTIFLDVDSFAVVATLGPDTQLCAGNSIRLLQGAAMATSYLWTDSSTATSLTVDTTGTYTLYAQDANGCELYDTLFVSILGEAPNVQFSIAEICFGDSTTFTDATVPPQGANIAAWEWTFGDGDTAFVSAPKHQYLVADTFTVVLTLTTDSGCVGSADQLLVIQPKPIVNFTNSLACNGNEVSFVDQTLHGGASWFWNFGDPGSGPQNTATSQDPLHTFDDIGMYTVQLTAANSFGCVDSGSAQVQVFISPGADFDASATCVGDSTYLTEDANGFNLTYNWIVNGQNLINAGPDVAWLFPGAGAFVTTLNVVDDIGCPASHSDTVYVNPHPQAAFTHSQACPGTPFQLQDASQPGNGFITNWDWRVFQIDTVAVANPTITINEPGAYLVFFGIEDEFGCRDSLTETLVIDSLPEASFNFSPKFGSPPLNVSFINASSADSVSWIFSAGDTTDVFEPYYTFTDTGTFDIALYAFNASGCVDSMIRTIEVGDPLIDLAIENVSVVENGDYWAIQATVVNLGSIEVNSADLSARFNGLPAIRETWSGVLPSGQAVPYLFTAQIERTTALDLTCVRVDNPNGTLVDERPGNNEQCISISSEFSVLTPFPNPAANAVTLQMVLPDRSDAEIYMYDYLGKLVEVVWRGSLEEGVQTVTLDVAGLRSGPYTLRVVYGDEQQLVRFVKGMR